ncbi:MFS transporter [Hyalangium versicolor]|uniref:MFS transporter n=1 Tax=Hyalangium versicolor TaxID=2861190 RepID=UPI001CCFC2BA|nr:MFS transporter [Hyalangium versicolor]
MLINLSPLRKYRDFRLLFLGQLVSFLGSMITYVAVPYQVYELTQSNLMVGLLGTVQLVPVLLFGLVGGSVADAMDRRKLLLSAEAFMSLGALGLTLNSLLPKPSLFVIFAISALMQTANGFHRPAMDAMVQKLVHVSDLAAVSALGSLRGSVGMVAGPAIGGLLIAAGGAKVAYLVDFGSFLFALVMLWMMRQMPPPEAAHAPGLESILQGLRYAVKRPELIGTYVVDIVAMTFAFPTALFPAMAKGWGGATAAGALFSAMSVGSLLLTALSGWTAQVRRRGAAVVIAAATWGAAVVAFGLAPNLPLALFFLGLAGAADTVSGLFRGVIWNETIPNEMRGRMSGIEMISYMTGPLIGNARAGWLATVTSTEFSITSGGVMCVVGVVLCGFLLPGFWHYRSDSVDQPQASTET